MQCNLVRAKTKGSGKDTQGKGELIARRGQNVKPGLRCSLLVRVSRGEGQIFQKGGKAARKK